MVFLIYMFKCIAVIFGKPCTQVLLFAIFKCIGFIFGKHCTQFSAQKPVSSGLSQSLQENAFMVLCLRL